jgi:hypothetical protein
MCLLDDQHPKSFFVYEINFASDFNRYWSLANEQGASFLGASNNFYFCISIKAAGANPTARS